MEKVMGIMVDKILLKQEFPEDFIMWQRGALVEGTNQIWEEIAKRVLFILTKWTSEVVFCRFFVEGAMERFEGVIALMENKVVQGN